MDTARKQDDLTPIAARFAKDCAALGLTGSGRLGLAVSGGPDSMALLLIAQAALPGRIEVATVDHGLRAEAAKEAAFVAQICADLGVPHETLRVSVPPQGNLQAEARRMRYVALAEWAGRRDIHAIATGHHRDDQAETLLMRLTRGAGTRGLAGMRGSGTVPGTDLALLRPLLGMGRDDLSRIVAQGGIEAVTDPSNDQDRFLRVRLRKWLATAPDGVATDRIATSASHLAADEEALIWASRREWDECVEIGEGEVRYRPSAPFAIRLRVVERIVGQIGCEGNPRGDEIARLVARLDAGGTATLAGLRCSASGGRWTFAKAPARRGGHTRQN